MLDGIASSGCGRPRSGSIRGLQHRDRALRRQPPLQSIFDKLQGRGARYDGQPPAGACDPHGADPISNSPAAECRRRVALPAHSHHGCPPCRSSSCRRRSGRRPLVSRERGPRAGGLDDARWNADHGDLGRRTLANRHPIRRARVGDPIRQRIVQRLADHGGSATRHPRIQCRRFGRHISSPFGRPRRSAGRPPLGAAGSRTGSGSSAQGQCAARSTDDAPRRGNQGGRDGTQAGRADTGEGRCSGCGEVRARRRREADARPDAA